MTELLSMRYFYFTLILCWPHLLSAQLSHPSDGELFRGDVIPRIDILLPQDSLDWILSPANQASNRHFQATFIFNNGTILDTLEEVGFRLRGNTSRGSGKKSFKVSFNTFESGRSYKGVEKLNLNGEHNDPSISRAKLSWDLARDIGIPAARSNHVQLYINQRFHGVYLNVEHIDEEFVEKRFGNKQGNLYKCLWPADLDYLGTNPDLYKREHSGRRAYDLKTNTDQDDYSDLAHFVDVLNNTPLNDLPCELEKVFHVDNYLKAVALDILIGNWDGPIFNKNNFYLYHNVSTDKFEYIPYDLDNTLGIDWFNMDWGMRDIYQWSPNNEPRPIYTRLMQVQEYKDRFSFYLNEILNSHYQSTALFPALDNLKTSLDSLVALDTFYTRSYGFSSSDFQQSFDIALPYFHTDYGIKPFITARRNAALNQISLNDIFPIINEVQHNRPRTQEDLWISASITDDQSVNNVEFCYYTDDPNAVSCLSMNDDGMSQDGQANDGIYGVLIPSFNQPELLHYVIKATDNQNQESSFPGCDSEQIFVGGSPLALAINEFMALNSSTLTDSAGEFDDWIELYNYGNTAIYLGDKYLSDKPNQPNKWSMPDEWIQPGEYLIFWADEDGSQGAMHANFKLSGSGETLGIYDTDSSNYAVIDEITFDAQEEDISYGRLPDGTGSWQSLNPTPGASNEALGIDQLSDWELEMKISPSPFDEHLEIQLSNPQRHEVLMQIFQFDGKLLFSERLADSFQTQINTQQLPSGLYFISLSSKEGRIYVRKLMKQ